MPVPLLTTQRKQVDALRSGDPAHVCLEIEGLSLRRRHGAAVGLLTSRSHGCCTEFASR
ncbi:MAG: hypothetical protein NTZ05_19605 [Chloroflexi bacterium]|nr:hypothetical protein [Chloroflexota bacterium]